MIGGLGHIGLPLALLFADSGLRVVCYDTDRRAAETVAAGRMPFHEEGASQILERVLDRRLFISRQAPSACRAAGCCWW